MTHRPYVCPLIGHPEGKHRHRSYLCPSKKAKSPQPSFIIPLLHPAAACTSSFSRPSQQDVFQYAHPLIVRNRPGFVSAHSHPLWRRNASFSHDWRCDDSLWPSQIARIWFPGTGRNRGKAIPRGFFKEKVHCLFETLLWTSVLGNMGFLGQDSLEQPTPLWNDFDSMMLDHRCGPHYVRHPRIARPKVRRGSAQSNVP